MKPVLSLAKAQERRCCRICGASIEGINPGNPVVLNYGAEHAHRLCLSRDSEIDSMSFLTVEGVLSLLEYGWFLMHYSTYFWLINLPDKTPRPTFDADGLSYAYSKLLGAIFIKLQDELEVRTVEGATDTAGQLVGRVYKLKGVESEYWKEMPDEGKAFGVVYPFSYS